MSKFKVKTCITVNIPESFRRDLQDLCDEVEGNDTIAIEDVLNLILEASPRASYFANSDKSVIINFIEGE